MVRTHQSYLKLPFTISRKENQMKNIFRPAPRSGFLFVLLYLFTSTNPLHAQWIQTNGPYGGYVLTLAVSGTNLFAGTLGGVFLSTNDGTSWTATGLTNSYVRALAVSGTNLFAGTQGGVFLSTNNGTSWTAASTGLTNTYVRSLAVSGTDLYAGTFGGGIFLSIDDGTNWTEVNTGLTNTDVYALAVSGTNLFAGTYGAGVFVASLASLPVEIVDFKVKAKQSSADLLWTTATEVNNYGFDVERRITGETSVRWNRIGFVAGAGTSNSPHEYTYTENNLPAGRYAYRIKQIDRDGSFKYHGNAEVEITAPATFALGPNFPNPFNPATTFVFSLPSKSLVSLKVFDALGREVSVVHSGELPAGDHSRQWDASGLPSGMYFYRLHARDASTSSALSGQPGSFTETRKLLLLR